MKKIILLSSVLFLMNCSSAKFCKRITEETLVYTFNNELNILEKGGHYKNEFGNILIEDCSIKNNILNLTLKVIDVYGEEDEEQNIKVYLFQKEELGFKEKLLLKESFNSSLINLKVSKNSKTQNLIVFKFNNSWENIIIKRL
ncbi:hypothetical protein LNI98_10315 [Tenacibaculum dicentrarchi]|nr:hypothetical protein [Tenacibaculum dicentrarchi]MCD8435703.1 hypothetical protein [Tenacibaculum dicentrarchi]MCD8450088.1 hypothetical protein [Tenacibaculum dicentrarchi]MCG8838798.1 hypothetical protein [Tenacibaculum dicentrarchi]MDB0616312.1 hypothetical protein [Tenacibaculum dicentrarchi]